MGREITAAIIREKGGPFTVETLELDAPRDDEVVVRVAGVGLCHTDLVCRDQYFPVPLPCVFGHEGSGIVVEVGKNVTKVAPGDAVVLSFDSCGNCAPCKQGELGYCHDFYGYNFLGTRPDGSSCLSQGGEIVHGHFFHQSSFADYAIASETNTVKVDTKSPLEQLGPLGCGIQTGAGAVMNALEPRAGSSIAIFGVGSVGLSAIMAARVCGCTPIIAIDPMEQRLELARELGATHVINPEKQDPVEEIRKIDESGVLFSLECIGLPAVVRQAVDCLALTGVCGVIGVAPPGTEFSLDMNSILFGRTIRGIIEGDSVPDIFIPRLLRLHEEGRFPFDKFLKMYELSQINEAVKDVESGEVIKAILVP